MILRHKDGSLQVGVKFAGHVVMAASVFAIVTVAAVGLACLLAWVHTFGSDVVPSYVQRTLMILEVGLFAVDVGGFVIYVVLASIHFVVLVLKAARRTRA